MLDPLSLYYKDVKKIIKILYAKLNLINYIINIRYILLIKLYILGDFIVSILFSYILFLAMFMGLALGLFFSLQAIKLI